MTAFGWKLVYDGRTPPPGAVVRPGERLSSLRMAGLGAQHVVVMLICFNLATVATTIYFPNDQWVALLTTAFLIGMAVLGRGFVSRIAVFLALVFGYLISWIADSFSTVQSCKSAGHCVAVHRVSWGGVGSASWFGLPKTITSPTFGVLSGPHLPVFKFTFILLVIPSVIALLAENSGHVKAVSEMTGDDLDPYVGRAFIGDGVGTAIASLVGGSPTTTYAENIGVMAATRIYSTLAYYIAAVVAILFGFCPKFGAVVAATPGGVAGGIIAGIGNLAIKFTSTFSITGIAAGTLIVIIGYHGVRVFRREGMLEEPAAAGRAYEGGAMVSAGNVETGEGEVLPFREDVGSADPDQADPDQADPDQADPDQGENQQQ